MSGLCDVNIDVDKFKVPAVWALFRCMLAHNYLFEYRQEIWL